MLKRRPRRIGPDNAVRVLSILSMLIAATPLHALAQESICAQVKIQIEQEATLERQAFDAQMKIANGLDTAALESVGINVTFQDESGATVKATSDPADTSALFFIRIDRMSGIDKIDGNGRVAAATTAEIHWLIIPSPGAGGSTPAGKLYLVGAALTYKLSGEAQTITVAPDPIFVKPLPKLALDYFLTKDVYSDDPFTVAVEPPEPFTLGVRIKNNGVAAARNVAIDSAQPKIVDNKQGLLVNFLITGGFVNDQAAGTSLLLRFGDIAPQAAAMGRWIMQSSLSGRFVDFKASFTHADDLGGVVTSILEQTNAHFLVKDVRVDVLGRDSVRDFLALDGNVLRVYESDSGDTPVTDQSAAATLTAGSVDGANVTYSLVAPATAGFLYVKLPDPFKGTKSVGRVTRSDGKVMAAENVWLSKALNASKQWEYFINVFDANSTGRYAVVLGTPSGGPQLPVLQFIPDRTVNEGSPIGFTVQGSSAGGSIPKLTAAPLPSGAQFTDQGNGTAAFAWTPAFGQAGRYAIAYTAANGDLQSTQVAAITVQSMKHKAGPDSPSLISPTLDADVRVLRPILAVQGVNPLDVVVKYTFELYSDAALTQLVAQSDVAKAPDATTWKVPQDLTDNTRYFWRARAFDGQAYSLWVNGRFRINLANDAPPAPQPDLPPNGADVDTARPTLSARDLPDADGDAVSYRFELFSANNSSQVLLASPATSGSGGSAAWTVPTPLGAGAYLWRVIASDPVGAIVESSLVRFTVNPNNHAPATPTILQPAIGASLAASPLTLQVSTTDADGDPLTYFFELDTSNSFGSPALRASGARSSGSWQVTGLADNTLYFWRAHASDGRAHSAWVNGSFVFHTSDQAPGVPVIKNVGPASWVDTNRPRFEVAPGSDPEGGALSYEFQLFGDAALTADVASAQLNAPEWLIPSGLSNGSTYYWRVRARNARGITSAWSDVAQFVVDTDHPATPSLAFSAPAGVLLAPGSARIAWQVRDPENASQLSLFFDRDSSGADGDPIVQNLALDPAKSEGSYTWDVSGLLPGAYYMYGVLNNGQRTVAAYAPGTFVVPSPDAHGTVVLRPTSIQTTSEAGFHASLQVSLGSAPTDDVVVQLNTTRPTEATLGPSLVTFTAGNWNVPQTVTVSGVNDCAFDGDVTYRVVTAKAVSRDTNYAGVKGSALTYVNVDDDMPTNQSTVLTCSVTLISSKKVSLTTVDYTYRLDITNLGPDVRGVQANVASTAATTQIMDGSVTFGPVPQGARATSLDTFTIRQDRTQPFTPSTLKWTLTPTP
jgi:hypothetical protein